MIWHRYTTLITYAAYLHQLGHPRRREFSLESFLYGPLLAQVGYYGMALIKYYVHRRIKGDGEYNYISSGLRMQSLKARLNGTGRAGMIIENNPH